MESLDYSATYLVGHDWAIDLLNRQQQQEQIPQAILLTGPPHVGKSTVGRFFIQSLNCQGDPKPCGRCLACHKMISGNHPDVRIFDSDDEAIKIDQMRELQRELSLSPLESQYRIALLCNFERATNSAANALLKTLEEPGPAVTLILTAADPSGLLPTVVSRCQLLALRPLPKQTVLDALQSRWQVPPEQAELLAQLAAGRLGWAVRALADKEFLERRTRRLQDLLDLLQMSRAERLAYAYELSRDSKAVQEALSLWLTLWRDLCLLQSGSQTKLINLDWQEKLQTIAPHTSLEQAKEMVSKIRTALLNLNHNVNTRLNLELLLLKLPTYRVRS